MILMRDLTIATVGLNNVYMRGGNIYDFILLLQQKSFIKDNAMTSAHVFVDI